MARHDKPLTCTFYVGGKQVDRLTPEQLDRMAERMGEAVSRYYTAHSQEYAELKIRKESEK